MKKALAVMLIATIFMTGCATAPHEAVQQLDPSAPKYNTVECQQARQIALQYDSNTAANAGAGLALGLFLGPFGIPVAMAMGAEQKHRVDAIIAELRRHCEGELQLAQRPNTTVQKSRIDSSSVVRLQILQELRNKGLITEDEFHQKRKQFVDKLIEE